MKVTKKYNYKKFVIREMLVPFVNNVVWKKFFTKLVESGYGVYLVYYFPGGISPRFWAIGSQPE